METCVVIVGSYINACSIVLGLQEICYDGKIYVIEANEDVVPCMADVLLKDVIVVKRKLSSPDKIVDLINENIAELCKKIILLTAEEFIEPIRLGVKNNKLKNTVAYTGSNLDNDIIFDRFKFYRFIEKVGYNCIPKTISSQNIPEEEFGESYIVRINRSWIGTKKLPRLKIVHSLQERLLFEMFLLSNGITKDMWSYQELLSVSDTDNVSVCGWYDNSFKQFVVTRKVIQHPPKIGNGDVVEVFCEAPSVLVEITETILKELRYVGPFEMEFVYDLNKNEYKIIELNPRFWMQHGLVGKVTENVLLKCALGMRVNREIPYNEVKYGVWINGNRLIYHIIKGNVSVLKYLREGIIFPGILDTVRWLCYYGRYKHAIEGYGTVATRVK